MALFPLNEVTVIRIYSCPLCNKYYLEGMGHSNCLVVHPPNTCCHYGDLEVSAKKLKIVQDIVSTKEL